MQQTLTPGRNMYYVEWAPTVKERKGRMVPLKALTLLLKRPDPGYSSYYLFREEDALVIKQSGSSRGLNQYPVASSYLVVDCDQGEAGRESIQLILDTSGYAYELWNSGGKGYHFYIPHTPICDIRLPFSHKQVALSLFPKELIDITLYQHGRLLSLPGRIHATTKQPKRSLGFYPGLPIEIPLVEDTGSAKLTTYGAAAPDHQVLAEGLQRAVDLICYPPDNGRRHIRVWGTATDLAQAGLDYPTVLNLLQRINDTWESPKEPEQIAQAVSSAYKRLGLG